MVCILREAEDAVRGTPPPPPTRSGDSTTLTSTGHYTAVAALGAKTSTHPAPSEANTEAGLIGTAVPAVEGVSAISGGGGDGAGGREHHRHLFRGATGNSSTSIVQAPPPSAEHTLVGRDKRRRGHGGDDDGGGTSSSSSSRNSARLVSSRFSFVRSLGRSWQGRRRGGGDSVGGAAAQQSGATADFSEMMKAIEVRHGCGDSGERYPGSLRTTVGGC